MISKVETDLPQGPRGAYSSWSLRQAIYCIEPIGTKGAVLAGNKTHKEIIRKTDKCSESWTDHRKG